MPASTVGLPEGTVTFVFTDIEGSTQRVAEIGDTAWARLLAEHHRILRETFAAGVEVNTEGDGFFVAFASAPEALQAAVSAQRALGSHPWPEGQRLRVRMGLHTGVALVRDDDYVGQQVHRASRVCDAAHGDQILLSEATAALVGDVEPEGVVLIDLGPHRLKDLGSPQRLFGVQAPGFGGELSPPRSLEAVANNLPVQRSEFIGRQVVIARVRALLGEHELVTLTGVGGAGKTRLALQVGAEELDAHPDGVFFVDLAPLSDPGAVGRAVADAVGLRLEGGLGGGSRSVEEVLVDVLAQRQCLLLLDNCEHLLDGCAELAERLLARCAQVRVLATSREPLGVEGEQVYRVPSLSLPDQRTKDGSSEVTGGASESVALFVERARSAVADFEPTGDELRSVGEICRRLDGIPLAIEFAAARVAHLSVGQIATRLDDRFGLLTGGRRRVRRQQTLEAALDWSFGLLTGSEQALLRRLAVFAGSFELEMAEATCFGVDLERADILDLLGSLVDKSLVATDTVDGRVRYRMLETVRSYAEGKLVEAGEAQHYRSAHRDAYLAWLETFSWQALYLDEVVAWTLVGELANLRAALQWSETQDRRDLVGRIAARCPLLWALNGNSAEGWRWLALALSVPEELDAALQAQCHSALAWTIMIEAGAGPEMEQHAGRAMELGGDHLGDLLVVPLGLRALGVAARFPTTGDPALADEASSLAHQALEVAGQHDHPWTWLASWWHGHVMLTLGDLEAAERSYAAVVDDELAATATARHQAAAASGLAVCRIVGGDPHRALEAVDWALERSTREPGASVAIEAAAALAQLQLGRPATAAAHLHAALDHAHPEVVPLTLNEALTWAAAIAHELGHHATASRLLAAATHVGTARQATNPFRSPGIFILHRHYLPLVRQALGPEEARRCRDQGRALTAEQAQATARGLTDLMDP